MSIRITPVCDVCKKDVTYESSGFTVWVKEVKVEDEKTPRQTTFVSCPMSQSMKAIGKGNSPVKHTCGADCAAILYHRWMSTKSLDMEFHPEQPGNKPVGLTVEALLGLEEKELVGV